MIETPRTRIRPYTEADLKRIEPILTDPATMIFWPSPPTSTVVQDWVQRNIQAFAATGLGRMLIEDKETYIPIGD